MYAWSNRWTLPLLSHRAGCIIGWLPKTARRANDWPTRNRRCKLVEGLSHLDVRQREALILQKYHGWTLAQIAEHLCCSVGAVAGLHARGLQKLRHYLPDAE
jgi:DNA-directed RNA polymerase specialized sigma24 family protein